MDDYMSYPTNKKVGGRTVWCAVHLTDNHVELFLPYEEEMVKLHVRLLRSSRYGRVHRICGGTEAARSRLLRECERRGIRAFVDAFA